MIDLARTHDLTPERVETIEVMPHGRRLPHTDNPDPRTPLGPNSASNTASRGRWRIAR